MYSSPDAIVHCSLRRLPGTFSAISLLGEIFSRPRSGSALYKIIARDCCKLLVAFIVLCHLQYEASEVLDSYAARRESAGIILLSSHHGAGGRTVHWCTRTSSVTNQLFASEFATRFGGQCGSLFLSPALPSAESESCTLDVAPWRQRSFPRPAHVPFSRRNLLVVAAPSPPRSRCLAGRTVSRDTFPRPKLRMQRDLFPAGPQDQSIRNFRFYVGLVRKKECIYLF